MGIIWIAIILLILLLLLYAGYRGKIIKKLILQRRTKTLVTISPPDELDRLKKRLLHLLGGDQERCIRTINFERRRSSHKSDVELYQDAIYRLERDRG